MVEEKVLKQFGIRDYKLDLVKHGHINRTYIVTEKSKPRYILQRLNDYVFSNPQDVMNNFALLERHLGVSLKFRYHIPRPVIKNYVISYKGYWRLFHFESDTHDFLTTSNPEIAFKAANAFANFDKALSDLDPSLVQTVIPNFHDLEFRDNHLRSAFEMGIEDRKLNGKELYNKIQSLNHITEEFNAVRSKLPVRVIHNDTKLSNLLFDPNEKVHCVIDLDTVMSGIVITDFGDMVRSMCNPVGEGRDTIDQVYFDTGVYNELKRGFVEGWEGELSDEEIEFLPLGAKAVIYEQAIRFLTDYLEGDMYYQIEFPEENLVRAEVHLKLLEDFLKKSD